MIRHNQSPIVTVNQEIITHCSKPITMSRKQWNVICLGPFLVTILLLTPCNFFFSEKICKGVLPHDKLINSTLQHTKNLNHRGPGLPRGGGDVGGMLKLGIDRLINRKEVWSLID